MTRVRKWRRLVLESLERRDVPSFIAPQSYFAGDSPSALGGGDFNNDGLNDIVVSNQTTPGKMSLLLGTNGGTFAPLKDFPAGGNGPSSIAVADFNGNNTLDVVVTNKSSGTVSVLRGSGTGVFRRPLSYPAGPSPTSIGYGEFNGDGRFDLVVANSTTTTVSVLINNGDGTYAAATSYNIGAIALSVITGEFNGDGLDDLIAVGENRLTVLLNTGSGNFVRHGNLVGGTPVDVAAGDFNSDGKLDLAVAQSNGPLEVRLGNGDGSFQGPTPYAVGPDQVAVNVEDLDQDGDLDIVALRSSGVPVGLLLNNGGGDFAAGQSYTPGAEPSALAVLDVTGDGIRDLAAVSTSAKTLTVLVGNGDGSFQTPPTLPTGPGRTVTVADLNEDGDPDITAVARSYAPLKIFLGSAGADFQSPVEYWGGGHANVAVHDLDNDGDLDLANVGFGYGTDIGILHGNGDGTFETTPKLDLATTYSAGAAGDLNGDAVADLILLHNNGTYILLGNGDGTFQAATPGPPLANGDDLLLVDLSADAILDVVIMSTHYFHVALGNGNGSFQPLVIYDPGSGFLADVDFGDINDDGFLDLIASNDASTSGSSVSLLTNLGNGSFQHTATPYFSTPGLGSVVARDFDGDSIDDVAVTQFPTFGAAQIVVLLSNGDGTFKPPLIHSGVPAFDEDAEVTAGDFNGDGRWDLVGASFETIFVLIGNGDGTFSSVQTYDSVFSFHVSVGDYNGDGDLDVISVGLGALGLLSGNGDGTFAVDFYVADQSSGPYTEVPSGDFNGDGRDDLLAGKSILLGDPQGLDSPRAYSSGLEGTAMAAADFNGDGYLDFAITEIGDIPTFVGRLSVSLGNADGSYAPAVIYATGKYTAAVVAADFNEDGILDLAATNLSSGTVSIFIGIGNGAFQPAVNIPGGSLPHGLTVGDFDSDGHLDLATTAWDPLYSGVPGTVSILLGNGNGTFHAPIAYPVGSSPKSVVTADFNGDGILDLATANEVAGTVSVLLGNGDGTFSFPLGFFIGTQPQNIVTADFNGDGLPDLGVQFGSTSPVATGALAILVNAADWPPLPIGDDSKPIAPLNAGDMTEEFPPTKTDRQTAIAPALRPINETETPVSPRSKYASRHIARVTRAETTDSALLFSLE